jgi:hypothetical protein
MLEMTYGMRDGELVSAKDVPRGLACGCICPACGSQLVARQGSCRAAHFAHHKRKDCGGWLETVLHQRAKALLLEEKKLMVPPVYKIPGVCLFPWTLITFEKVDIEVPLGNGRADAIGIVKGRPLAVEFAVTHKVSESRILEYRELEHPAVEIDLPQTNENFDTGIASILEKTGPNKRWIYNPHVNYNKLSRYAWKPQSFRRRYYTYE